MMIRIEITSPEGDLITIVNGAQQEAWLYSEGEWVDISTAFSSEWDSWRSTFQAYSDNLSSWTGAGDWTYTDTTDGSTVTITNIMVNPSLADSLFEP